MPPKKSESASDGKVHLVVLQSDRDTIVQVLGAYTTADLAKKAMTAHSVTKSEKEHIDTLAIELRSSAPTKAQLATGDKLAVRQRSKVQPVQDMSDDEEEEEDELDDEPAPRKKAKAKGKAKPAKQEPESDDEEAKPAAKKTKAKPAKQEPESDDEDDKPAAKKTKAKPTKQVPESDDEDDKPAAKKTKAKATGKRKGDDENDQVKSKKAKADVKSEEMPEGTPGSLDGVYLLFTGTLWDHRKVVEATAKKYGATIVTSMRKAHFIVVGAKPGPDKVLEIKKEGYKTMGQAEFFEALKNGVKQEA